MTAKTRRLRELLDSGKFLYMPSAATPLEGRLAEAMGVPVVYTGGYVTGASRMITEPLLTMDEQVRVAGEVARAVQVPLIADAGAGFGEPLHTMRTVREFAAAGVAGIHIEDQLFPKRAHYHAYQVHAIPLADFTAKIRYACRQRDETDRDFVIIARTDTCREFGLDEAIPRINAAAEAGADLGLLFPRNREEAEAAPRLASVPLIWVQSPGNRDGRPILPNKGNWVATIRPDATIAEAVDMLHRERIGAIVVSNDGDGVDGILSERDIVAALAEQGTNLLSRSVDDVMTHDVITCDPGDTVGELMAEMTNRRIRHFPVISEGRLCGIVSIGDLVKNRLDEVEFEAKSLRSFIAGG